MLATVRADDSEESLVPYPASSWGSEMTATAQPRSKRAEFGGVRLELPLATLDGLSARQEGKPGGSPHLLAGSEIER
jgi:hypothetical protein